MNLRSLQLRTRAARLQVARLEDATRIDPDLFKAFLDARVALERAEHLTAIRLGRRAAA